MKQYMISDSVIEYMFIQKEIGWLRQNIHDLETLLSETPKLEPTRDALCALRRSYAEKYWDPAKGQT